MRLSGNRRCRSSAVGSDRPLSCDVAPAPAVDDDPIATMVTGSPSAIFLRDVLERMLNRARSSTGLQGGFGLVGARR